MGDDLLIINGLVKSGLGEMSAKAGYVAVAAGLIREVGVMSDLSEIIRRAATEIIDAQNCLVMPGLVNCHNHCAMTLFRGLADDLPLLTWLQEHIFPAEARMVDPEMVYWCSRLAATEMIMSGTTTVADGYFFEEQAAQAFKEIGLRAVAAQGVIDFPAPGVPDPGRNLHAPAAFIKEWRGDSLITPAVFCHSSYTCSPATISGAKHLARDHGVPFFIHLAETAWELAEIKSRYEVSPLRHLSRLGVLDEATICIHAIWLDEDEISILQDSGAAVVTCPESNMKLASGVAPVPRMLAAGIPVGLGTDGCASNNDLDLLTEMRSLALLHKVLGQDPTVLPAPEVVRMATAGGTRVLSRESSATGVIAPGSNADLILIDLQKPHLTPRFNFDSLLTYAATGADVRTTIIGGKVVMAERRLLTSDLSETIGRVNELASRLRAAS